MDGCGQSYLVLYTKAKSGVPSVQDVQHSTGEQLGTSSDVIQRPV